MNCDEVREALSALLDGEEPGRSEAAVQAHVGTCAACAHWQEAAHAVTRRMRLAPAVVTPDLTDVILASAPALREAQRWRADVAGRLGLVSAAVAQLILAVPVLLFGHDHGAAPHVAHELGSFDVALAVGFIVAAHRPNRVAGLRPVVGVATVLLLVTAGLDIVNSRTDVVDEAPHLLDLVGFVLLWIVTRPYRSGGAPTTWWRPTARPPTRQIGGSRIGLAGAGSRPIARSA